MKLTTPYAVLTGFALVALAIASQPLTGSLVPDARAQGLAQQLFVQKVAICDLSGFFCVNPTQGELKVNVCEEFNGVTNDCANVLGGRLITRDLDFDR